MNRYSGYLYTQTYTQTHIYIQQSRNKQKQKIKHCKDTLEAWTEYIWGHGGQTRKIPHHTIQKNPNPLFSSSFTAREQ